MTDFDATGRQQDGASRRARIGWCLYDWANSAFPTVIVTFVFSAYFARGVASDVAMGTAQWGWALSLSAIAIAILSPIFGAISDRGGRQKPWLAVFSALCICASAALWFVRPDPAYALYGLILFALANAAFEIGMVFYNAMLPRLAPPRAMGRLSGWGWGLGYAGGLTCLVFTLFAFVRTDAPLFGLNKEAAEHIRIVGPLVAIWFALFAIPLFLWVPDGTGARAQARVPLRAAISGGLATLWRTVRNIRTHGNIARFLLARLIYIDGLNTLFAFGGIYAAGTFAMSVAEIIEFGIALNITAGLGAAAFAWIDDWIGAKRTVLIALGGMMAFGAPLLFVDGKLWFWLLALPLGIFMGPAQAASRSLMARLAPPDMRGEMFGLFALSGKVTAFLGPALLGWATLTFDSQRAGMATILVFFVIGAALLAPVREGMRER